MMVLPMVRTEAVKSFQDDLRERGLTDVERGRTERTRSADRKRLQLQQVTGTVSLPDGEVPVEGWVCVTTVDDLYVTGGAYPRTSLARALGLDDADADDRLARDPTADREALFDLVRAVG